MSEAKFTKGPWVIVDDEDSGAGAVYIGSEESLQNGVPVVRLYDEANANLIAAAPEMYDALETIKRHIMAMPLCDANLYDWVDRNIDPLLAKARGEA